MKEISFPRLRVTLVKKIYLQSWDENCMKVILIHLRNLGQRRIVNRILI